MIRLFQAWCFGVRDSWFHWGCVKAFPKRWRLAQLGIYEKSFAGAERSHWLKHYLLDRSKYNPPFDTIEV